MLTFEDNENDMLDRILSLLDSASLKIYGEMQHSLIFQGLKIDEFRRIVVRDDREIELTYIEFEIVLLLAKNSGMVFSKERIYDMVWKEPYTGDYNIVMSHIHNIREKIEDNPRKPIYIQTVWGVGYRFNKNLSNSL